MNARCEACGAPNTLRGSILSCSGNCSSFSLGGEGSGVKGHTTQRDAHRQANGVHYAAYRAHKEAAYWLAKPDKQTSTFRGKPYMAHAAVKDTAQSLTKGAVAATKATGAKPYSAQAAQVYAKKAETAKSPADAVKWHKEAAQMHKAAAQDHLIASRH